MKTQSKIHTLLLAAFFVANLVQANAQDSLTQLSGIIADEATDFPVAYSAVEVVGTRRGTLSNEHGFFSIVVGAYDTIKFSSVGYKSKYYIVPDSIFRPITSIGIYLKQDTLLFNTVEIYPWPSPEEFRQAFLAVKVQEERYRVYPIPGIKGRD